MSLARINCRAHGRALISVLLHAVDLKMDQQEYDRLYLYLRSAELPSGFTKNQKDSLKRKSKSFIIRDDALFFRDAKKGVELKVS